MDIIDITIPGQNIYVIVGDTVTSHIEGSVRNEAAMPESAKISNEWCAKVESPVLADLEKAGDEGRVTVILQIDVPEAQVSIPPNTLRTSPILHFHQLNFSPSDEKEVERIFNKAVIFTRKITQQEPVVLKSASALVVDVTQSELCALASSSLVKSVLPNRSHKV